MTGLTCQQALEIAQALGLDRLDAHLLLLHSLGKTESDRAWLLAHDDDPLEASTASTFHALTLRRAAGEPLAYIVGYKEFFGLKLKVDSRVLIPRPDTETLVEWALDILQAPTFSGRARILDLGTGSGAVALALARSLSAAGHTPSVLALDASAGALAVAADNARGLKLDVQFVLSHWFEKVSTRFHLIASNPPYVASQDAHLADLLHEPIEALASGCDGLEDIRNIIQDAPDHLDQGAWLLLEHGYDQSVAVRELLARRGFVQIQSRCDIAGIARCSGGQWGA